MKSDDRSFFAIDNSARQSSDILRNMKRFICFLLATVAVQSSLGQTRVRDVIYLKQAGSAFTMDVFKPAKPNGAAIVWIVSGGWFSSHEMINPDLANAFMSQGFTVFEVVHGAQPKFVVPEILGQLRHAIRFIRANAPTYGIDPGRIGVSGGSAGGHLSLMLAGTPQVGDPASTDPLKKVGSEVQAVVAYYPPTDFANWGKTNYMAIDDKSLTIFMPALGVTPSTPKDKLTKIAFDLSPMSYVKAGFPPTLLIHGDKDALVPPQQSQIFNDALARAGAAHDLIIVAGSGHDGTVFAPTMSRVFDWFTKYLVKK